MKAHRILVHVDPQNKKGLETIKHSVNRVLASYSHGLLVETTAAQQKALEKEGYVLEPQQDATLIKLRAVHFDTATAVPVVPTGLRQIAAERTRDGKPDYCIVQFVGPALPEWTEQLIALGLKIESHIPENAVLVRVPAGQVEEVKALPFVNWVGLYEPAFKVSPLFMGRKKAAAANEFSSLALQSEAFRPSPEGNVTVVVHDPSELGDVVEHVKRMGGTIVDSENDTIITSIDVSAVEDLAKQPEVKWVEPFVAPVPVNDQARQVMTVQPVFTSHGLDGDGQIVAVADTGLDVGVNNNTLHADFRGKIVQIHDRVGDGANDINSGHGTHVAGSILGNGSASNGAIQGTAPSARLVFQAIENNNTQVLSGIPADYNNLFLESYNDGARIMSNSWGATRNSFGSIAGQYTTGSQDIDEFMWNHKDAVILFAAANGGVDANSDGVIDNDSLAVQATAKNCITVGASENNRATGGYTNPYGTLWPNNFPANPIHDDHVSDNTEGMAAFSSRGPTDDGRVKPDVVAPGTNILSTRSSAATGTGWGLLPANDPNRPFYMFMGGTSMATPLTAGTVALIREYLQRVKVHASPSGALLKAMLIHGAHDMTGQYTPTETAAIPNNNEGWGRVDLQNTLFPQYPIGWDFHDDPAQTVATGTHRDFTYSVVNSSVPFRVTLVWTDFPSDPAATIGLVNELRISVTTPNGAVILGTPANNNVQQVVINNPQSGTYTVRINGVNVRTVATLQQQQDFALVVSGGLNFVDLYIKDTPNDNGLAPSVGTLCCSPDIWTNLDNDPALPPAPNPEYGQTNYVFVKVHNRGPKIAGNATVTLYWANPGTYLSRPYWKTDGIKVAGTVANSQQVSVPGHSGNADGETVAVFEWLPPDPQVDTLSPGHFCLFATVTHPDDPILQEDVGAVGLENNLAWKNVDEKDMLPNTESLAEFYVAGDLHVSVNAALRIDCKAFLPSGTVKLKIPTRWLLQASMTNLKPVWQSEGGHICRLQVTATDVAVLDKIKLQPGENTLTQLEVLLPKDAVPGHVYPISVEQWVNGSFKGRVTLVARTVGTTPYVANSNTAEIHVANCEWVPKISPSHKVPFKDLDLALRRGYNGCRFCLPEVDTD